MKNFNSFDEALKELQKSKTEIEIQPEDKKDEKVAKQLSILLNHYMNDKDNVKEGKE